MHGQLLGVKHLKILLPQYEYFVHLTQCMALELHFQLNKLRPIKKLLLIYLNQPTCELCLCSDTKKLFILSNFKSILSPELPTCEPLQFRLANFCRFCRYS